MVPAGRALPPLPERLASATLLERSCRPAKGPRLVRRALPRTPPRALVDPLQEQLARVACRSWATETCPGVSKNGEASSHPLG